MKQNRLGTSDLWVSEVGFGCMSLGSDRAAGVALLEQAFAAGVTFFDTADLYDHGENERTVGEAFRGQRDRVVIATKVGNRWNQDGKSWRWDPSSAWLKEAVQHSLRRLRTDYIDLYQLHGGTLDDPLDETVQAFEDLKAAGLIRAYGVSSIRPQVIRAWTERSNLTSVMMQYNLLDRRPEELLDLLRDRSVSVVARGPVAKGLLADKPAAAYLNCSAAEVAEVQRGLEAFTRPDRSRAQLALRYALADESVASVIPGASTLDQLTENVAAADAPPLTPAELDALRALTKADRYEKYR